MFRELNSQCLTCRTMVREPDEKYNTFAAGSACTDSYCADMFSYGERLAQIQFPIQKYTQGFCPETALCSGTLFPELVH